MLKKTIALLLCCLAAACGDGYEEVDVLSLDYNPETDNPADDSDVPLAVDRELLPVEDKIFMPSLYGGEADQSKCSPPYSGGKCLVPDTRSFMITVDQYTCPSQIWKDQILDAANHVRDVANANGWNISVGIGSPPPAGASHWHIACANDGPAGIAGQTSMTEGVGFAWDCHANNTVCQYKRSTSKLFTNVIPTTPEWINGTNTQRGILLENVGRHELGHMFGLWHGGGSGVTGSGGFVNTDLRTYTNDEKSDLDCYNEASGTTSNC